MRRLIALVSCLLIASVRPVAAQDVLVTRPAQSANLAVRDSTALIAQMLAEVSRLVGASNVAALSATDRDSLVRAIVAANTAVNTARGAEVPDCATGSTDSTFVRRVGEAKDKHAPFGLPFRKGRPAARCLYGIRDFSALSRLSTDVGPDQQLVTADIIRGVVGAFPVAITSMLVTSKSQLDSVAVAGEESTEFVDGASAAMTALTRNGGNLTFWGKVPLFNLLGPDVRLSLTGAGGVGLLGDLSESETAVGSYSIGLEGSAALTVKGRDEDAVLGTIFIPARWARVGTFSDLMALQVGDSPAGAGAMPAGMDPGVLPRSFGVFQLGFGLANPDGKISGAVTATWSSDDAVDSVIPRLSLNLKLLLAGNDGDSGDSP